MSQEPCTILRDALAVSPSGKETIDSPLIDIYHFKDIKCANPQITFAEESLAGVEVIARTIRGSACGFTKVLGKGSVVHLGTWIGFDTEGHKPVYEAILEQSGAKLRHASAGNDFIAVRERFTSDKSAMLFIGNYYNEDQSAIISYTHPESHEMITIPYSGGEMMWPPLYGVLTPVCLRVAEGLMILHSTSDILHVEEINGRLEITLYGDRDMAGEIVFEGFNVNRINSVTMDGKPVQLVHSGFRMVLNYSHEAKKEMSLKFRMI
jgi:hypothetical protein